MNPQSANFFVLTGGPGAGKTTLINYLADLGYRCMPEAGRAVIRQQRGCGGAALPWNDKTAYARLMYEHDMAAYRRACNMNGPVFLIAVSWTLLRTCKWSTCLFQKHCKQPRPIVDIIRQRLFFRPGHRSIVVIRNASRTCPPPSRPITR